MHNIVAGRMIMYQVKGSMDYVRAGEESEREERWEPGGQSSAYAQSLLMSAATDQEIHF